MLLILDIPLYDLLGLHVKIPDRPHSRHTLEKDSGSIYFQLQQSLTCILEKKTPLQNGTGILTGTKRL